MNVVSFYSYKGGTGRTTTMANVAVLLAQEGYDVCCIDLDISAPGLDLVFEVDQALLEDKNLLADFFDKGIPFPLADMCIEYTKDVLCSKGEPGNSLPGKLYIFPAPRLPDKRERVEPMIDGMVDAIEDGLFDRIFDQLGVDYILLDARSGFSRECAPLFRFSDKIFVSSRFTRQHLAGLESILNMLEDIKIIRKLGTRQLDCFVLINDVPNDLPENILEDLEKYKQISPKKVIIRENKELRWSDKVIVLDNRAYKDELARKQFDEVMNSYQEIIGLMVDESG